MFQFSFNDIKNQSSRGWLAFPLMQYRFNPSHKSTNLHQLARRVQSIRLRLQPQTKLPVTRLFERQLKLLVAHLSEFRSFHQTTLYLDTAT
jgi:hypothetical protein